MITLTIDDDIVPVAVRLGAKYDAIIAAVNAALPNALDGVVSIAYVSDEEIRRLNRMYRQKDAVTDVLSFAGAFPEMSHEIGDVLVCYDQALRQSDNDDVELECVDLVVHGILHVLGYDHERAEDAAAMFPLQDAIVSASL